MPSNWTTDLLVCTVLLTGAAIAIAQDTTTHEASNADPNAGPVGERPYEMAGRVEERTPLVACDDVAGWTVEGANGEGWLYRTQEQRLYRDYCAKLVYVGRGDNPTITVRPPAPIPIPEPWGSVNLWNYGNNWGWAPDPATPPLSVSLVIRDASGREAEIQLGGISYEYWFLMNGRLSEADRTALQRPMELVGFRFRGGRNTEPRAIYLGPCYFFEEDLRPLSFDPWPDELPFPTRKDTILPTNKTDDYRNAVAREGEAFVFSYRGEDGDIAYRYSPSTGTFDDIELLHGDHPVRPLAGGGMQLAAANGDVKRELVSSDLDDDRLTVRWRLSAGGVSTVVEYGLRIKQKSLIIDMQADAPVIERVSLGRAEGVSAPKLIRIPYLTFGYGATDPHALYDDGLFLFAQFDHHFSDASVLYGGADRGEDYAVYNGGAQYIPKTDGQRNLVRERLFLTASPDFQEVLPNIPNPPSPFREDQGRRLWRVKHDANHAEEIAEAKRLRSYGLEYVTIRYHENSWRDAGESFTFRTQAAPKAGGDAALRDMVSTVQSLGWRVGLYTNYTDYAPVNSYWNEDWVSRTPSGDWQRAWMRCYAPKPMVAVRMEAQLAPQIHAKFGENHSYCDVHTAVTPFDRVDYDARVPGAGTFRQVFECFGRLLYNEKFAHHGPVYSEGLNHWWYAGLTDGNYGQLVSGSPPTMPLLVDFDLLKMHPLEMDAGMGAPGMFFRGAPLDVDQFVATTMAYGHIGYADWDNLNGVLKNYYMMQQIQSQYAMRPVGRIEYGTGAGLVDTSAALATDAYLRNQVHVAYENGTEVYVNGSDEPWVVPGPDGNVELPKWGYIGWRTKKDVLSRSAVACVGGPGETRGPWRRLDLSLSPEQCYADSRGSFAFMGPLACEGAFALKREEGSWVAIPAPECADAAFSPDLCDIDDDRDVEVMALAEDGTELGHPETRWSRGLLHILSGVEGARRYRIGQARSRRPAAFVTEGTLAVTGGTMRAVLPEGAEAEGATWEIDGRTMPAVLRAGRGVLSAAVPADLAPDRHLWLRLPAAGGSIDADFVTVAPVELSWEAGPSLELGRGEGLPATLVVRSNLARVEIVSLSLSASGGARMSPQAMQWRIPARADARVEVQVALPWATGDQEICAAATVGATTVEGVARLHAELAPHTVLDLMNPAIPMATGFALRGAGEIPGLAATNAKFERSRGVSGGIERACLFSHPPYGASTGYVYAAFDLDLPPESARLTWYMGMRDGLDATDGVTFRVVVVAGGAETEVFAQHYAECRWQEASADLSPYAGQRVQVKLIADAGPRDDTTADHALWGDIGVCTAEDRLRVTWN